MESLPTGKAVLKDDFKGTRLLVTGSNWRRRTDNEHPRSAPVGLRHATAEIVLHLFTLHRHHQQRPHLAVGIASLTDKCLLSQSPQRLVLKEDPSYSQGESLALGPDV